MKKNNKKQNLLLSAIVICIIIGLGFLLYPIYQSRIKNRQKITETIEKFEETIEKFEKQLKEDDGDSSSVNLDAVENENQIIGILYVPKINVILPIYNNTSEYALSNGAGILREFGKPYGENGTHPVLTSHAGLEDGLFTNLFELENGDSFYIKDDTGKYNKYEVFKTDEILPTDYSKFIVENDKSLVTLLTCTSVTGFNSHRLLKHGQKVQFDMNEFENEMNQIRLTKYEKIILGVFIVVIVGTVVYIIYRKKQFTKKEGKNEN